MNPVEVEQIFEKYDVLQRGHFRLSSGRHSDTYLQCQQVLGHPRLAASFGEALARRFGPEGFDVVVSPALGGILIGNAVAYEANVRFVFAERHEGTMTLRRGQRLERGERAVVVEDVVTTGGSAAEVIGLVEASGASVVGVAALVDRTTSTPPFHLEALLHVKVRDWDPAECPLCAAREPMTSPGSRYAVNRP